ncbi:hypothetical protein BC830DRAFT_238938 [Chytriomyces sp. MP71]|nr:hypothetical protein BC830DRAFT_238938 [Chytriomyces sp. MP71]
MYGCQASNEDTVGREAIVEPVHSNVIAVIRKVTAAAPRIVVVIPPALHLGTQAVERAFGFGVGAGFDYGAPIRYVDLANSSLSLDVRIWATQMDVDTGGLQQAISLLFGLLAGITQAILGDWAEPMANSIPKSKLPELEDEVSILNTFYRVLENSTDLLPESCVLIIDGVDSLSQLCCTPLGKKAIAIFINHLASLTKGIRKISVVTVASGGFAHEFLMPMAAHALVALIPFGDLSEYEAKEHYMERLREVSGAYAARRDVPHYSRLSVKWGHDVSIFLDTAEANFDLVFGMFGGRAMDLVASADSMLFTFPFTRLEERLRDAPHAESRRAMFQEVLEGFNDVAATMRWLELKLDPFTFDKTTDISIMLENRTEPLWTLEEAVALFKDIANSHHHFLAFDEAVASVLAMRGGSRSEAVLVIKSLIEHKLLTYRPSSNLYFDGLGSTKGDYVNVARPLHLFCFTKLLEKGAF